MNTFAAIDFETANGQHASICSMGDESCLKAAHNIYGMPYPNYEFLCTCRAARKAFPHLKNHKLDTVAAHIGFDLKDHHHALADAEACAEIARKLMW